MLSAAIITSSDSGYRGEREDLSGLVISEMLKTAGYEVKTMLLLPDERQTLAGAMTKICDEHQADFDFNHRRYWFFDA